MAVPGLFNSCMEVKKIHALRKYEPCVLKEKKYQGTLHFLKTNIFFLLKKIFFFDFLPLS